MRGHKASSEVGADSPAGYRCFACDRLIHRGRMREENRSSPRSGMAASEGRSSAISAASDRHLTGAAPCAFYTWFAPLTYADTG